MKSKNGKTGRMYQPANIILDGQMEAVTPVRFSWLAGALGLDEDTRVHQRRALAAELFLQTSLFPLLDRAETIDEDKLIKLLILFKHAHPDLNTEFEMSQVSARLLHRFQCRFLNDEEEAGPPVNELQDRDTLCLIALASLDFQRIDEAVRGQ